MLLPPPAFFKKHEHYVKKYGNKIPAFEEEKYFGYGGKIEAKAPAVEWLDDEEEHLLA